MRPCFAQSAPPLSDPTAGSRGRPKYLPAISLARRARRGPPARWASFGTSLRVWLCRGGGGEAKLMLTCTDDSHGQCCRFVGEIATRPNESGSICPCRINLPPPSHVWSRSGSRRSPVCRNVFVNQRSIISARLLLLLCVLLSPALPPADCFIMITALHGSDTSIVPNFSWRTNLRRKNPQLSRQQDIVPSLYKYCII